MLSPEFQDLISVFQTSFRSYKTFKRASLLVFGSILTFGPRTVCNVLRFLGRCQAKDYSLFHQVLNRSRWSPIKASEALLGLMVKCWSEKVVQQTEGYVVFAMDEHIERRQGGKIRAKGVYRDAVRSTKRKFVKTSGLRWICLCWIGGPCWLKRLWALPFLTVLAPSAGYAKWHKQGKHKKLTDWARQMVYQTHRWLKVYPLVFLGDNAYSAKALLSTTPPGCCWITPLRWDAVLHDLPQITQREGTKRGPRQPKLSQRLDDPNTTWKSVYFEQWYGKTGGKYMELCTGTSLWYSPQQPMVHIRWVIIRDPNGQYESRTLLCTDINIEASTIVKLFQPRWSIEVTFAETRRHLGLETQRQWSDKAIARTTPVILANFSLATLWADQLSSQFELKVRNTAWYDKHHTTFSDVMAFIRRCTYLNISFKSLLDGDLKDKYNEPWRSRPDPFASIA